MLLRFKALRQAAALPYIWGPRGVEVALITSRERKRWIIPKGWPERGQSLGATAALEATEEAGIAGVIAADPIGSFTYEKRMNEGYTLPCRVFVFPLLACEQRLTWKEAGQRKLRWLPLIQAADRADDPGLAKVLKRLVKKPETLARLA